MKVIAMTNKRQNLKQGNTQLGSSVYIFKEQRQIYSFLCSIVC